MPDTRATFRARREAQRRRYSTFSRADAAEVTRLDSQRLAGGLEPLTDYGQSLRYTLDWLDVVPLPPLEHTDRPHAVAPGGLSDVLQVQRTPGETVEQRIGRIIQESGVPRALQFARGRFPLETPADAQRLAARAAIGLPTEPTEAQRAAAQRGRTAQQRATRIRRIDSETDVRAIALLTPREIEDHVRGELRRLDAQRAEENKRANRERYSLSRTFAPLFTPLVGNPGDPNALNLGPLEDLGFVGVSAADLVRFATQPATLLTAGAGSGIAAGLRGVPVVGRAAGLVEPLTSGGFAQNLAAEVGVGALGQAAGQAAAGALPENASPALRAGVGIAAGLGAAVGGVSGATGIRRAVDRVLIKSSLAGATARTTALRRSLFALGEDRLGVQHEFMPAIAGGESLQPIDPPDFMVGRATTARGTANPNATYEFQYRIVDADELVASHLDDLAENPTYAQALQPRQRGRAASAQQVDTIARNLNFDELTLEGTLDRGAPIIGPDLLVESGNGRVLGIRRAIRDYPDSYQAYRDALSFRAGDYGLSEEALRRVAHPVLVRERVSPLTGAERQAFVRDANATPVLRLGTTEQAAEDARLVTDQQLATFRMSDTESVEQAILSTKNMDFRRQFFADLPANERAALADANGMINQAGVSRIKQAMFASTYQGDAGKRMLAAFFESTDETLRNVENAVYKSLPQMSRTEALIRQGLREADYSISEDLAAAVEMMARLRQDGIRVDDYLRQIGLFGDDLTPMQARILAWLEANKRSRRNIEQGLIDYAETVEAAPSTLQGSLFGESFAATKEGIWRARVEEAAGQRSLFGADAEVSLTDVLSQREARSASAAAAGQELDAGRGAAGTAPAAAARASFDESVANAAAALGTPRRSASDAVTSNADIIRSPQPTPASGTQAAPSQASVPTPQANLTREPSNIIRSLGEIPITGSSLTKPIVHQITDLEQALGAAESLRPRLERDLRDVAEFAVGARVKGGARLRQKLEGRPVETVSDLLGGRAVVRDAAGAADVIRGMQAKGWQLIESASDAEFVPRKGGYVGRHVQLLDPHSGLSTEIQLQSPGSSAVQELAHRATYERARVLTAEKDRPFAEQLEAIGERMYARAGAIDPADAVAVQQGSLDVRDLIDSLAQDVRDAGEVWRRAGRGEAQVPPPSAVARPRRGGGGRPPREPPGPPPIEPTRGPERQVRSMLERELRPGEPTGQEALRLYEGALDGEANRITDIWEEGNRILDNVGIGQRTVRGGRSIPMRPQDWLDPANPIRRLFLAIHNEGPAPEGYGPIVNFTRRVVDAETKTMQDFDPKFMAHPDYFPRGWMQIEVPEGSVAGRRGGQPTGRRPLGRTPSFQKQRVNATFAELLGHTQQLPDGRTVMLVPRSSNPVDMLAERLIAGVEHREQRVLVDRLKQLGLTVELEKGANAPAGYRVPRIGPAFEGKQLIGPRVPKRGEGRAIEAATAAEAARGTPSPELGFYGMTNRLAVEEGLADALENMFGVASDPIKAAGFNVSAAFSKAGNLFKRSKLWVSFFQDVDFALRTGFAAFTPTALRRGAPLSLPAQYGKLIWARTSAGRRRQLRSLVDSEEAILSERPGITLKGIHQRGWKTRDLSILRRDLRGMLDETIAQRDLPRGVDTVQRITAPVRRRIAQLEEANQAGLFEGVYPQSQIHAIQNFIVPRLAKSHPEWTDEQIMGAAAAEANKMFSTLGEWQTVLKNRPLRSFLHNLIFSTNESEALLRQAFSTVPVQLTRRVEAGGKILPGTGGRLAIKRAPNARLWQEFYLGGALFLALTANAINLVATGELLPLDRYSPITRNRYSPLGFGYNNRFFAADLPIGARNAVGNVSLDLVGQMDTIFRVLDPVGFVGARTNVMPRALINQLTGEDFFGRPLEGAVERAQQLAADLALPIGIGNLFAVLGIGPENEGRLGTAGLLAQSTGVNLRAPTTREVLDRFTRQAAAAGQVDPEAREFDDLEPAEQRIVTSLPGIQQELAQRRTEAIERGDDRALRSFLSDELRDTIGLAQKANDGDLEAGRMSVEQWKDGYRKLSARQAGGLDVIFRDAPTITDPQTPLEAWLQAVQDHTLPNLDVDWDAVDRDIAKLDGDQFNLDPGDTVAAWIDRNLRGGSTPTVQAYRQTITDLDRLGFFDLRDESWSLVQSLELPDAALARDYESFGDYLNATVAQLALDLTPQFTGHGLARQEAERRVEQLPLTVMYRDVLAAREAAWLKGKPISLIDRAAEWEFLSTNAAERRIFAGLPPEEATRRPSVTLGPGVSGVGTTVRPRNP